VHAPAVPAPRIVDSTGAGDCFAGTLTARLALGDGLLTAVRLGSAAASLSLAGQGGTGHIPTLPETRAHLAAATSQPAALAAGVIKHGVDVPR
jgi:2-dehydro-3-deoxygluconokinase